MSPIKDVTGTAFVVAEFRARENEEPHPLFVDPVVPIFLDARARAAADAIRADFPAAEKMPRLRTRYFDDRFDEQLGNGCRQVVILGAGLDTRAERKRSDGVAYFEIDDASTVEFKRQRLAECAVIMCTTGEQGTTGFVERFAAMGAPWHYGIDDLKAVAAETGLTVADSITLGDMHRKFWPERPLESIVYEHYNLCTLKP